LVPADRVDEVIVIVVGAMTSERVVDCVCGVVDESVTWNVKLVVLLAVALPEMTPVAGAKLRPEGREPLVIDQV
jgi:hypothetical protein